ncbi:MAG: VOC family protein [Chloroflexota bacterium]
MQPKLDLIGIVVENMAKALAFYRAVGLDIPAEADGEGHVEITLDNGLRMAWDTYDIIRSFDDNWQPPTGHQQIGLAFLCDNPEMVDATWQKLIDLGYESNNDPFDAYWGQRYAQVKDPDGNVVDFFADKNTE